MAQGHRTGEEVKYRSSAAGRRPTPIAR
jgi:hypothetical protein